MLVGKKEKREFDKSGQPNLEQFKQDQETYNTIQNILADNASVVGSDSISTETGADVDDTIQNKAQNRSSNVLSDINNVTEPPPEETPDPRPLDEMRTAVRGIEGLLKDREAKLTAQEAKERELLDKDREMVRGAAKAKFLTDLGSALLKGDGTGGGFFSEFGKAGAEAVKGSQKATDVLRNLNKEERKLVTDSANRQFQNELSQYQQQLKLGEITLQEYKLGIEQTKANLGNYIKQIQLFDSALSSTMSLFDKARSGEVELSSAVGAYSELRDRLPDDVKAGYDKSFNELIEAEPEANLNKFKLLKQ